MNPAACRGGESSTSEHRTGMSSLFFFFSCFWEGEIGGVGWFACGGTDGFWKMEMGGLV